MYRNQIIIPLLKEICNERQIKYIEECSRGMFLILLFENHNYIIKDVNFNLNNTNSSSLCKNKAATSYFLEKMGYQTPVFTMVFDEKYCNERGVTEDINVGIKFAKKVEFPVILKPNNLSQGRYIYKANNISELNTFAQKIFSKCQNFQLQKFYNYNDYRIVVLNKEVISAYQRIPLNITGNGKDTVKELIELKQNEFISLGRDTIIDLHKDTIRSKLEEQKINHDSIIPTNKTVFLENISNLSAGGDCVDIFDEMHDDYKDIAICIANDLNLALCGIDIMCSNIFTKISSDYIVLEVNSSPGLDNYVYSGDKQKKYVKSLYNKIISYIKDL